MILTIVIESTMPCVNGITYLYASSCHYFAIIWNNNKSPVSILSIFHNSALPHITAVVEFYLFGRYDL